MAKSSKKKAKSADAAGAAEGGEPQVPIVGLDMFALDGLVPHLETEPPPAPDSPEGKAEHLLTQARKTRDDEKRLSLARQALEAFPDSTEAYILIAEHAAGRRERLGLFQKAVEAGERRLGERFFAREAGRFWLVRKTRPYMQARQGLAEALWAVGRRDEAIGHLWEMLRLNPGDNQGVRYTLAAWLFLQDRPDEVAKLLKRKEYDEDSANWDFAKVLLAFRQEGDGPKARKLLKAAMKGNEFVVPALLAGGIPPGQRPASYSPGSVEEAYFVLEQFLGAWKSTSGAVTWLRQVERESRPKPKGEPTPVGPTAPVKKALAKLPQEKDEWEADFRRLPWVNIGGAMEQPWVLLVLSGTHALIHTQRLFEQAPEPAAVWDTLAGAMTKPAERQAPHRPTVLHVGPAEQWAKLKPHIEKLGVKVLVEKETKGVAALVKELTVRFAGPPRAGLLDSPGAEPERVGKLFEAAAEFHRAAPWRLLPYENAVKVECPAVRERPWYAVVFGQSGTETGLAIYDDMDTPRRLWAGRRADEQTFRRMTALTLTFGEEFDVPPSDCDAVRTHGWPVAGPEAFPHVFRKEPGLSLRPPLAWEMDLMEGCLRTLAGFLTRHADHDRAGEDITIGKTSMRLTKLTF